jgi:hypothetical protein
MTLSEEEQRIVRQANNFARSEKKRIARGLTDKSVYTPEQNPVSVFMAGSPGAGKTEASLELVSRFGSDFKLLRIDADEYRGYIPGYTGENSHLVQTAATILLEKVHDYALKQSQSFIMDGTLSNLEKGRLNVERSIRKGRLVQILYVYQDPLLAWEFVKAREQVEGRRILKEHFIEQYFNARDSVNALKTEFDKRVQVDLLVKNIDNSNRTYHSNVQDIDRHIRETYTPSSLDSLISE